MEPFDPHRVPADWTVDDLALLDALVDLARLEQLGLEPFSGRWTSSKTPHTRPV